MAPVLASLTIRPARRTLSLAFIALLAAASPAVHSDELPVTESEAYDFVQEFGWVNRSCDADRLEQLILPDATLTFTIEGEEPIMMSRDEYVRDFRKHCFHTRESYDSSRFSVRIERGRAIATGRWERGQQVQFFFLDSRDIDWVEQTMIVVRAGDVVGLQEMESLAALATKDAPASP